MKNAVAQEQDVIERYWLSPYAEVSLLTSRNTVICTATSGFIPMAEFEKIFERISEVVKLEKLSKLIFDKRQLTAFHLPSMEWHNLVWKEEMYRHGLSIHRKLLPDDPAFVRNVINGRKKIMREHPSFDFDKYDILYCKNLTEAMEK